MKIAQLSFCYQRTPPEKCGGIAWVVSVLTEELVRMGHEVTLFATGDSSTEANLWFHYEEPPPFDGWGHEIIHVSRAYDYIRDHNFDIIHNHSFSLGLVSLYGSDIPCVTSVHAPYHQLWSTLHKLLSKRHRFISLSERQREIDPEPNWVGTVHNAIDVQQFPFSNDKKDYLLFMGRMNREKGVHLAIRAARAAGRRLKLVGPLDLAANERGNRYFEEEIAPEIDGRDIEYFGEADFEQKTQLYSEAAGLLFTSQVDETSSLVVMESLACGTPVIGLAKGAIPELVRDGETGFLATSLSELVAATKKLDQISPATCREYAERNFSASVMAERYLHIYEQVLEEVQSPCGV